MEMEKKKSHYKLRKRKLVKSPSPPKKQKRAKLPDVKIKENELKKRYNKLMNKKSEEEVSPVYDVSITQTNQNAIELMKMLPERNITEEEIVKKYNTFLLNTDDDKNTQLTTIKTLRKTELIVDMVNNTEGMIDGVKDNLKTILDFMQQYKVENDKKFEEYDKQFNKNIKDMMKLIEEDRKNINSNNEKMMNMLAENINKGDIKQLEEDTYQLKNILASGVKNIIKNLLYSPITLSNIIVFKPAIYFFHHTFGKWFYYIWGGLMFLLVILLLFSLYINLQYYSPTLFNLILKTLDLFKICISHILSNTNSQIVKYFSNTIDILKEYIYNGVNNLNLYNIVSNLFNNIINYIVGSIKSKLTFSLFDGGLSKIKYQIIVNNDKLKLVKVKLLKSSRLKSSRSFKKKSSSRKSSSSKVKNDF